MHLPLSTTNTGYIVQWGQAKYAIAFSILFSNETNKMPQIKELIRHALPSSVGCRLPLALGCRRWRSIGCRPTELQLFAVVCSIDVCLRPKRPKWSALCRWQMVRNACPTKQKDPLTSHSCRASRIRSERKWGMGDGSLESVNAIECV